MNDTTEQIKSLINNNHIVLFMKGTRVFPQCGFSASVVQILNHLGVEFKDVNVLDDEDLRPNLKTFSNWPTFPQLYVNGNFLGGCDIIREMFQAGELDAEFKNNDKDIT